MIQIGEREVQSIAEQFRNLPDPRSSVNGRHRLVDVMVISVLTVLGSADGPVAIAQWAALNAA